MGRWTARCRNAGWMAAGVAAASLAHSGISRAIAPPEVGAATAASSRPASAARPTRAVARVERGGPTGRDVRLIGGDSSGADLRFRWVQVAGDRVALEGRGGAEARFEAPPGPGPLGFLLVVTGAGGSDTAEVAVPPAGPAPIPARPSPVADAGDDQIGVVGNQVTLHGGRSGPAGAVGFRWIQTGGPAARFKIEEGPIHSFVPSVPGVYRFALVVAADSAVSEPDEVIVRVGPGLAGGVAEPRGGGPAGGPPAARAAVPTQEIARAGLAAMRGGRDLAEPLARIFEETADRLGVYQSYGEAYSEMSRRLEEFLTDEPVRRQAWGDRVFQPLSARMLEVLRAEGLELLQPGAQDAALGDGQKAAIAEQFRLIAEGSRSTSPNK